MKNKVSSSIVAMAQLAYLFGTTMMLIFAAASYSSTASPSYSESDLRAAIVLKIIHLVSWPQEPHTQLNFCANGNSDTTTKLRKLIDSQPSTAMRFLTSSGSTADNTCHIQILGSGQLTQATASQEPLLVICDGCASNTINAAIELVKIRDRISFNLNLAEAKRKNIRFKVSLMEHANAVKGRHE